MKGQVPVAWRWAYVAAGLAAVVLQALWPELIFGALFAAALVLADAIISAEPRRCALRATAMSVAVLGAMLMGESPGGRFALFTGVAMNGTPAVLAVVAVCTGVSLLSRGVRRRLRATGEQQTMDSRQVERLDARGSAAWGAVETVLGATGAIVLVGAFVVAAVHEHRMDRDLEAFVAAERAEWGCGEEWERAVEAYRNYLSDFPDGRYAEDARAKADELAGLIEDREEWTKVEAEDTAAAYEEYLDRFPHGRRRHEAQVRIYADQHLPKGLDVYLYEASPPMITESSTECTVKYVRRKGATVRGELVVGYIGAGDAPSYQLGWAFASVDGAPLPELTDRRGTLSVAVFASEGVRAVELVFMDRDIKGGVVHARQVSNAVRVPVQ